MGQFVAAKLNMFLAVVRKYMQVRGGLSQKDLAELTDVGVSTISRLLNQKTKELDPHIIAKITAKLEIPLHEIIDFIEEDYTDKFKRLISFHKGEDDEDELGGDNSSEGGKKVDHGLEEALGIRGTAKKSAKANVRIGNRTTTIPFESDENQGDELSIKDKLARLSPRQKAYISDFLSLDAEGRDLVVDLGNSLYRYFRQKGVEF